MTTQSLFPVVIRPGEISRKQSLGGAIELCAEVGGYALDKSLALELGVDAGQFSRWTAGTEGIKWEKLRALMDACGNDAPLLWMLHQRGWDLNSMRKLESETERALRLKDEALQEAQAKIKLLTELVQGRAS